MTLRRKRTPDGVNYGKPIALRLMPAEREQAEDISKKYHKTKSALAREAYLLGLPLLISSLSTAEAADAVPSSGVGRITDTTLFIPKRQGDHNHVDQ